MVKGSQLFKTWYFWLIIITAIAIILRSIPAWVYTAWGCDFGIYYGLTNSLIENGELYNLYAGWGKAYQFFPVLYAITGGVHWLTGLDVLTILPKLVPIFGGLSVLIFYFVVNELLGNRKTALLASLLFAVMPFHVYQTSHASPLTIGHFFMMLSIYFFLKYRKDIRYLIPLALTTILLIMSHHFTTYFYLISMIFIVFVENASRKVWTDHVKIDSAYILLTSGLVFAYWILVARPVFDMFMNYGVKIGSFYLGSTVIIPLFYVGFFALFGIIWLKRRLNLFTYKGEPTEKRCVIKFVLTFAICLIALIVFSVVEMPWTSFSFTPLSIVYSLPLLLIISFGVVGFRYLKFIPNGGFIKGWLLAILLSFVFSLVTHSAALYPHRHLEYMMAPLSILAIYGLRGVMLNGYVDVFAKWREKYLPLPLKSFILSKDLLSRVQKRHLFYLIVVSVLVTANAISVYPAHVALNASYEVITDDNLAAIDWIDENIDHQTSIIVSDHRIARLAEAAGYNTTIDEAWNIWEAIELSEYIDELYGIDKNYKNISHVIIDDIMRYMVVHVGFGIIEYMTEESYEKFFHPPFNFIHREATLNSDGEEIHWTEVFEVDWEYLEGIPFE